MMFTRDDREPLAPNDKCAICDWHVPRFNMPTEAKRQCEMTRSVKQHYLKTNTMRSEDRRRYKQHMTSATRSYTTTG